MSQTRQVIGGLMIVGMILGIVVNFVPFQNIEMSQSGNLFGVNFDMDAEVTATPWEMASEVSQGGETSSNSESWFDEGFDDEDGIGLVRSAGPLLVVTTVFALIAGLALVLNNRSAGLGAGAIATVAGILHTTLFSIGINDMWDNEGSMAVGAFMAIAMTAVLGIATIIGAVAND